jgi:hypothetical protein
VPWNKGKKLRVVDPGDEQQNISDVMQKEHV